jgi:DNA-binding beta-propeller fold protein YncE
MKRASRRLGFAVLSAAALAWSLAGAPVAHADTNPLPGFDPFFASPGREPEKAKHGELFPPPGGFEGPCGIGVDSGGDLYVSDYYRHHIDAFTSLPKYVTQLTGVDPLDGPCGLALDAAGDLFVNDFHRDIVRYTMSPFPLTSKSTFGAGTVIDSAHPTGVAFDPASGDVYVDDRTYIAVYEPSGAAVEVGGEQLRIGSGSLADGYGVAISDFPATAGDVYVPDAGDDTVKVYDPSVDTEDPIATIDGHENPTEGFISLQDAAVAIDQSSGQVYVSDDLLPDFFEQPEAAVYAFEPSGTYGGRLKLNVIDARPPGLAVDNSGSSTQGRVYVTSGNTEGASVYAYGPGAASKSPAVCAEGGPCPLQGPGGVGTIAAPQAQTLALGTTASPTMPREARSRAGDAAVVQRGNLRVGVNGSLAPRALPRRGVAPVAVSVSGRIATTDGSAPPQLKTLRIELNRHGRLDFAGLPVCPYDRIQPASSARALAACRPSLVGQGHFEADIVIAGQQPYPARGRLLVFNGQVHGHPALFGQIYAPRPFANSFVIVFAVHRLDHGSFGAALTASLPKALGSWGRVTAIDMRLGRRFSFNGARHSYLSAGCPAPAGFPGISFPLARASFTFVGGVELAPTLTRACSVR